MGDENKQHVDSLNVQVFNHQSLRDRLPVIEHAGSSGKGFPYAPEDFPSPGDVWTWRVGKRYTHAGFWQDRSVHPPDRLQSSTGNNMSFRGRASLEQYIRKTFPDADVDAFFASFVWKIPCTDVAEDASLKAIKSKGCSKSAAIVQLGDCKASNEMCIIKAKTGSALTPATCNICCSEPNFCRNCCCILCSKTIDWIYDGYSFIKCEAQVDEKFVCGHVAHIECALRAYLAGKVGGSIDLDAQYYCRCCDNKTDLLLHVQKIIKVSESIDNRDDMVKVLNLGFCMLRGSEKERAEKLQIHIATSIEKLKHGVLSEDIWRKRSERSELEQGKGKGQSRLDSLRKYKSADAPVHRSSESDHSSKRDVSSRQEGSPHQQHKRRQSRSPPREHSKEYKHHRSYSRRSHSPDRHSDRGYESSSVEHATSIRPSSYHVGKPTSAATLSTMTPLQQHSGRISTDRPDSPYHSERLRITPVKPLNVYSLNLAVEYAASSNRWMLTAEHNIRVLTEKYELAKARIERDRSKIRILQDTYDDERRERRKVFNSLDSQCRKVTEAEEAVWDKRALVDEMDKLVAERDGLVAAAITSQEETQELRQQIKNLEEEQTFKDQRIAELEMEQTRLLHENNSLNQTLAEREETIADTSDSIDALLYNIWKNGGLGKWSEDYNDWMRMICKHSIWEGRRAARAAGRDFDKQQHLRSTFNEEELAIISATGDSDETESESSEARSESPSLSWTSEESPKKSREDGEKAMSMEAAMQTKQCEDLPILLPVEQETENLLGHIPSSPPPSAVGTSMALLSAPASGDPSSDTGSSAPQPPMSLDATPRVDTEAALFGSLPDLSGKRLAHLTRLDSCQTKP